MCGGVDGPSNGRITQHWSEYEPRPEQSAEDRYISKCISRDLGADEEEIERMKYKSERR